MKWLGWEQGRQGTGYEKFCLFASERLKFDCYLLRYRPGSRIPLHVDTVDGYDHHRINITVWRARLGGYFWVYRDGLFDYDLHRFQRFRPDLVPHMVSTVKSGTRYVLSIGWLRVTSPRRPGHYS